MTRLEELYHSFINDSLRPEELEEFWGLVRRAGADDPVMEAVFKEYDAPVAAGVMPDVDWERAMDKILSRDGEIVPMHSGSGGRRRWRWIAAAAAVLIVVVGGGLLYRGMHGGRKEEIVQRLPADLPPGHNGAVLTLGQGQQIVLDSMGNGNVARQSGMTVVKIDGRLAYHRDGGQAVAVTYNTLTVPRGRQFELVLPDSTKVWLNSASSLRFPTAFVGGSREVSLTGEAYFEVKSNARAPFRVSIGGQQVEVLGTSFNINGYEDEAGVRTTLVDGSVQVRHAEQAAVKLSPGQQAQMDEQGKVNLSKADVEDVLAWKEGWFRFNGQRVEPIMRQLSRWYDVDVLYEGTPPATRIGGEVPRNMQLSKVLDVLRLSGVNLAMKDGKIIVKS